MNSRLCDTGRVDRRRLPAVNFVVESLDGEYEDISDDELTALALAADPEQELSPDAVPLDLSQDLFSGSLPLSYMPPAMARAAGGWRVPIVVSVILALLLIEAFGLCITYGSLVAA